MFERIIKLIEDDDIEAVFEQILPWIRQNDSHYKYKKYELKAWSWTTRLYKPVCGVVGYNNTYCLHDFPIGPITPKILKEASKLVKEHELSLLHV